MTAYIPPAELDAYVTSVSKGDRSVWNRILGSTPRDHLQAVVQAHMGTLVVVDALRQSIQRGYASLHERADPDLTHMELLSSMQPDQWDASGVRVISRDEIIALRHLREGDAFVERFLKDHLMDRGRVHKGDQG